MLPRLVSSTTDSGAGIAFVCEVIARLIPKKAFHLTDWHVTVPARKHDESCGPARPLGFCHRSLIIVMSLSAII